MTEDHDQTTNTWGEPADKREWTIDEGATIGYEHEPLASLPVIGDNATIRAGTIIYCDVPIRDGFSTGHDALVREETLIGDDVYIGSNTVIDGISKIGSHVSMQTGAYVPSHTTIGDNVFLGPHAVLTNDPYPVRQDVELKGPTIEDGPSIGATGSKGVDSDCPMSCTGGVIA